MSQIFVNTLISASFFIVIGLALSLIYRAVKFFDMSLAGIFVAGPYCMLFFYNSLCIPLFFALIFSCLLSSIIYYVIYFAIYKRFEHNAHSPLSLLLASFGIYIILQNVISIIFGDRIMTIRNIHIQEGILLGGAMLTPIQLIAILYSIIFVFIVLIIMHKTKYGLCLRTIGENFPLAQSLGVSVKKTIVITYLTVGIFVSLLGIIYAYDVDIVPTMGMNIIMMGIIVMIIGGNGIMKIIIAGIILSLAINLGAWYIGSEWKEVIAFAILLFYLLMQPRASHKAVN